MLAQYHIHIRGADHKNTLFQLTHLQQPLCRAFVGNKMAMAEFADRVPEQFINGTRKLPTPSICATRILFSAPTVAQANASILSPCTTNAIRFNHPRILGKALRGFCQRHIHGRLGGMVGVTENMGMPCCSHLIDGVSVPFVKVHTGDKRWVSNAS